MTRTQIALLLAVILPACVIAEGQRLTRDDRGFNGVATEIARQTGCDPQGASVELKTAGERRGKATFIGSVCERSFSCVSEVNGRNDVTDETVCTETAVSVERGADKAVVERLAIETGCPRNQIALESSTGFIAGQERSYRFTACAKSYICSAGLGRTDCKPALSSASEPQPIPAEQRPEQDQQPRDPNETKKPLRP